MLKSVFDGALIPSLFGNSIPGHTTRTPPIGFELATSSMLLNLDKTSLRN